MIRVVALLFADEMDEAAQRGLLAAAAACSDEGAAPVAVLVGRAPSQVAAALLLAKWVLLVEHPAAAQPAQADQLVAMLMPVIENEPDWQDGQVLFVLPTGLLGEEVAARLAARTGGAALGRCDRIGVVDGQVQGRRGAYGGRATINLGGSARLVFAALQASGAARDAARLAALVRVHCSDVALPDADGISQLAASGAERLESARIVVAGGRGMGGPEGFSLLQALSRAVGGALGGSLPTIDEGWLAVSHQIGQSGRFVTPEIYVAVAISGTLQHLAGVSSASRIVAINKDPAAAIFEHAEVGVIADWAELLPRLLACLDREQPT